MKLVARVTPHMQPNSSGTIIDRKLIETSEKHKWSSRPPTNMIFNFMESL
jgi:hypothetical protein